MSATVVESLIRSLRAELTAFVRKRAGHLIDPDDVVQEASIRALAHIDQLRDPARGRAWLFRIVRNVLADDLRRLGVPVREVKEEDIASVVDEPSNPCRCALTLAKSLKPEYSDILERVVVDDAPIVAVATDLGVTPNNATVRLHRARRALREVLEEHCGTVSLRACMSCVCDERGCCATH